MAAAPPTSMHLVPEKYLEGRKLEIFFPCLFDQISYLDYVSFCLSYQDGLNGIGKKNCEVGSLPCTCDTYLPENAV